jgi:hypothetical protein
MERHSGFDHSGEAGNLDRRVSRLASERGALFDKAGADIGLSTVEQQRLGTIERELDECFLARRRQRAEVNARRFEHVRPSLRRGVRGETA